MNEIAPAKGAQITGVAKFLDDVRGNVIAAVEPCWTPDQARRLESGHYGFTPDHPQARVWWLEAKEALTGAPSRADVQAMVDALDAALGQTDARQSRALLGTLFGAFPSGRPPDFETYADTALHDVLDEGFSPTVIAIACRDIRRKSTFLPSIAEIVAACEEAKSVIRSRLYRAREVLLWIDRCEMIVARGEPANPRPALPAPQGE